jgi:hypothetical protein
MFNLSRFNKPKHIYITSTLISKWITRIKTEEISSIVRWNTCKKSYRFNASRFNKYASHCYVGSALTSKWNTKMNLSEIFSVLKWNNHEKPHLFNNRRFNVRG